VHSRLLQECREMGGEILLGGRFADVCAHLAGGDVEAGDEGTGKAMIAQASSAL